MWLLTPAALLPQLPRKREHVDGRGKKEDEREDALILDEMRVPGLEKKADIADQL